MTPTRARLQVSFAETGKPRLAVGAEMPGDCNVVGNVAEHPVVIDRPRLARPAVAAYVDRDGSVAGGRENRQLMAPGVGNLWEAVHHQHDPTIVRSLLDIVDPHAVGARVAVALSGWLHRAQILTTTLPGCWT
jgi:hypothetical protein